MFERWIGDKNDPMSVLAGVWGLARQWYGMGAVGDIVRRHLVDISPGEKLFVKI